MLYKLYMICLRYNWGGFAVRKSFDCDWCKNGSLAQQGIGICYEVWGKSETPGKV